MQRRHGCQLLPLIHPLDLIEYELNGFHQSLAVYRQQVTSWYAQALDKASHATDLPSLLGMERVLRVGDSKCR
ncbi:hypothetical protein JTY93_23670 [Pseudomonas hygromyciniae]|uniref:Uncharacterized protein n=1 Tax=Pseudomonas hygromyciniae TaxID=2812000 RepID=A0ABX7JXK9_9PSED|nr:hypothetical protein [Pseudomonas hygromyciniae]QSB39172.1 hypothetical protein JTY93_23670 [Pseudomonas hygromyciniae]